MDNKQLIRVQHVYELVVVLERKSILFSG